MSIPADKVHKIADILNRALLKPPINRDQQQYQIKIDISKHLLQMPEEPTLVVENAPRRTAVSEIPPIEDDLLDPFVRESLAGNGIYSGFVKIQ